jgi:hypothetical protein
VGATILFTSPKEADQNENYDDLIKSLQLSSGFHKSSTSASTFQLIPAQMILLGNDQRSHPVSPSSPFHQHYSQRVMQRRLVADKKE